MERGMMDRTEDRTELAEYFPMWKQLTPAQQQSLSAASSVRRIPADTVLRGGSAECFGLILVKSGQLRAYILSEDGREVTIYRLFERDICLFSASCMMNSIQFDITVETEKESKILVIAPDVYRKIMEESAPLANYTNQIMASRFSEVMWLIERIMWQSFDKRLAEFLLAESSIEGTVLLKLTHEKIAAHLGTAREVVTRMLRYFKGEGLVALGRGTIELLDVKGLSALCS